MATSISESCSNATSVATGLSSGLAEFTDLHLEVVEGMLVDVFHLLPQPHGVVGQRGDVRAAFLVVGGVVEARGRHVSGADGLDLLQLPELLLADNLLAH